MTLSKWNLLWALVFPPEKLKDWAIWFLISISENSSSLSPCFPFLPFLPHVYALKIERYVWVRKSNSNGWHSKFFSQLWQPLVVQWKTQPPRKSSGLQTDGTESISKHPERTLTQPQGQMVMDGFTSRLGWHLPRGLNVEHWGHWTNKLLKEFSQDVKVP